MEPSSPTVTEIRGGYEDVTVGTKGISATVPPVVE